MIDGLRQLRDETGAHQVGWRSPTVDDDETASQQHGCQEVRMTELEVESYVLAVLVHSAAPVVEVEGSTVGAAYC